VAHDGDEVQGFIRLSEAGTSPVWGAGDNLLLIPRNMGVRTKDVLKADLKQSGPLKQRARLIALANDEYFRA
jgi:hypothetical protein